MTNDHPVPPLTARDALKLGQDRLTRAGFESARLEMSLLLAQALGTSRLSLYADLDRPLNEAERLAARELLARRLRHEPIAYLLGEREFYGLALTVTPAVLIPRPETEHLVDAAIDWLRARADALPAPQLADIGTGSGAIAIAVAQNAPASRCIATDTSPEALAIARANTARHALDDRIELRQGDLLAPLTGPVDLLCSNPPYVAEIDRVTLARDVVEWEPGQALFSGGDGLDCLRRLIAEGPDFVRPGGLALFEFGYGQSAALLELAGAQPGWRAAQTLPDLAGIPRVLRLERA